MKEYFFISESDGALYDTRADGWSHAAPLRPNYRLHHSRIASAADFKACLRAGGFAWPGGYPLYFIAADGEAISFKSARENAKEIMANIGRPHDGWNVVVMEINWEDSDLTCSHSGEKIESAYSDD